MPTSEHEALHRIFQEDTDLIGRVLTDVLDLPIETPVKAEVMNVDLTDLAPAPRWADTLLQLQLPDGPLIAIIESQGKKEPLKRRRWARYIAHLQDTHDCDVSLIVTCRKASVARWAAEPFKIGPKAFPSMVMTPMVLGPDNVPVITQPEQAGADVHLAVLSALVHNPSPNVDAILNTLAGTLDTLDVKQAAHLAEFIEVGLGKGPARQHWRNLMATRPTTYISELRAQGRAQGKAEGEARILLLILEKRGIEVTEAVRERITTCTDTEQLEQWAMRAATATTADELFSEGA